MISAKQLYTSVKHAWRGVRLVFMQEQNFRIQIVIAIIAIILSLIFGVSTNQFIIIFLLIGAVLSLEMINSIFERIIDSFKPRIHPAVKDIKDIMAGAVLVASTVAAIIGITIFWPYFIGLF